MALRLNAKLWEGVKKIAQATADALLVGVEAVKLLSQRLGVRFGDQAVAAVLDQLDKHFGVSVATADTPAARLAQQALSVEQFHLAAEQLRLDFAASVAAIEAMPTSGREAAVASALARSRVALAMVAPQRVVLVGRQNAGKSSLFNQLLFRERALTGSTPGLTRDAIAEVTTLGG